MIDMETLLVGPTRTHNPITDPTSFPTVVPDQPIYQEVGKTGMRTLWTVFVMMTLAFLGFSVLGWKIHANKRILHSLTTVVVLINGLTYLAMATGSGSVWHHGYKRERHDHGLPDTFTPVHRQVFWVRGVDWLLTTPMIIADLALLAGLNGSSLFSAIIANTVLGVAGLVATMSYHNSTKWAWFTIMVISYLWIIYTLFLGVKVARSKSIGLSKFYTSIMAYSVIVWLGYPIVWAIASSNQRKFSKDAEVVAFAVLDVLSKGVFGAWLLGQQQYTEAVTVEGFWAHGLNPEDREGRIQVGDEREEA